MMDEIHYRRKLILDHAFRYGEAEDDFYDGIMFGEDELGKYILYHYPGNDYHYFYESMLAEFDRWIQTPGNLNFLKARKILNGFGKDDRTRMTLIKYEGKYYICKGITINYGSTKNGPRGESCFHIAINNTHSLIKTERAFRTIFNKLDKYEL